ncbi:MAG TPA: radical SAM protein [Holophagaceae bacterium]|nr:radical SAM protein [Holophagaceae bacterium]
MDLSTLPIPDGKVIASIYLLPDCNMSCRFCGSELDFSVISPARAVQLLGHLRTRGFTQVVLGGGEPFLWPHDLVELCRQAKALGYLVQVCTNGTLLPAGIERESAIDRFILPLEAATPALHDRLRRHAKGHHAQVLAQVDRLAAAGRSLTLSTVVTRENLPELPVLADQLEALKASGANLHAWHLYRFLPTGRQGRDHGAELLTSTQAYRAAVAGVRTRDRGFTIYRRSDMLRSSTVAYFWADDGELRTA